jgi:hypothetical protein
MRKKLQNKSTGEVVYANREGVFDIPDEELDQWQEIGEGHE